MVALTRHRWNVTPLEKTIEALEQTNALYAEIAAKLEEYGERGLLEDLMVRVQSNADLIRELNP
jgi:uncharacterized protein HemY